MPTPRAWRLRLKTIRLLIFKKGLTMIKHDYKNRANNAQNSNRWTRAGLPIAWLVVAFTFAAVLLGALNFFGV